MTIKDYLGVIRQRVLVVLITIVLTTCTAVLLMLRQTPEYEAKSRLLVVPLPLIGSGTELTFKYGFQRGVATEAEIVKSAEVASRVIARLELDKPPLSYDPEGLMEMVEITALQYTEVLEIKVRAPHPNLASDIANAFPEEYITLRREEAIRNAQEGSAELAKTIEDRLVRLNAIEAELKKTAPGSAKAELLDRQKDQTLAEMSSLEATRQGLIDASPLKNRGVGQIIARARPVPARANADLARTAVLGLIIGIPLALGIALLLDAMSDTIRSREEAEKIVGAEALGVIPLTPEWRSSKPYIVSKEAPYSAAAEAFRTLRINLDSKGSSTTETRRILFTSPGMGEGKTTTSANLGVAYAEAGRSALLISADLRRPRLHQLFGIDHAPGLTDLLEDPTQDIQIVQETSPNLYVIPSGTPGARPDQLLSQVDVKQVLEEISVVPTSGRRSRPRNDENGSALSEDESKSQEAVRPRIVAQPNIVLMDSPSVLGAAEVSGLAKVVDGVILVLQAGVTRREAAARAAEQIRRAGGQLIGLVLVGVKVDDDYSVYPPADDFDESSDSTWSKVVSGLRG